MRSACVWSVTPDRVVDAAAVLAQAMDDDPFTSYLEPHQERRAVIAHALYAESIERAICEGRADAFGEILGVAIWMRRPAFDVLAAKPSQLRHRSRLAEVLDPEAVARAERFGKVLTDLRRRVRPDEHAYLDSLGVLRQQRRRGIASALLDAGHAWADAAGLTCALDALTETNVNFYRRRGYQVVAQASVPGSNVTISTMRRTS